MRRKSVEGRGYTNSPLCLRMRPEDLPRVQEAFDLHDSEGAAETIPIRLYSQMGLLRHAVEEGRAVPRFESELAEVRSGVVILEDGSAWAKTPLGQGWAAVATSEFTWDKKLKAIKKARRRKLEWWRLCSTGSCFCSG